MKNLLIDLQVVGAIVTFVVTGRYSLKGVL
jgi:hypothetical protein